MTKAVAKLPESEWMVVVKFDDVPVKGKNMSLSPSEVEAAEIAKRLDIITLDKLDAELTLKRHSGHILHVAAKYDAIVTQPCVITLEPVVSEIHDEFEAWFADESRAVSFKRAQHDAQAKKDMLEVPVLDESEDPDPMINGQIDLGDLICQYLSLSLPTYPCKEGVVAESVADNAPEQEKSQLKLNPFAALKNWKPKD